MVARGGRGVWPLIALWVLVGAVVAQGVNAAPARPEDEIGSGTGFASTALTNDCPAGEIYDDGTAENGYSGNPASIDTFEGVQQFTPSVYPTRYKRVCLALTKIGMSTDLEFEIVMYDDDGGGGTPGTELGAVPVSATDLPESLPCTWYAFDISSLAQTVRSGSVFIGVRWNVDTYPSRFICSDESGTTTLHLGFVNFNIGGGWQAIETVFPSYRALLVRGLPKIVKKVSLRAKPSRVAAGEKTKLVAKVTPCVPGDRHLIKFQEKRGGWKVIAAKKTKASKCKAAFRTTVSKPTRYRAKSPGNAKYFPATSRSVRVRTT